MKTAEVLSALGECLTDVCELEKIKQYLTAALPVLQRGRGPNHTLTRKANLRIERLFDVYQQAQDKTD